MTEPDLVLEFDGANLVIDREDAVRLIETLTDYLDELDSMGNGAFVNAGKTQNVRWN